MITLAVVTFAAVLSRSDGAARLAESSVVRSIARAAESRRIAHAAAAMSRAVAGALLELEGRIVHFVTLAHHAIAAVTALVFSADDAISTTLFRVRVLIPPLRLTTFAIVPLALAACASFALPWLS